MLSIKSCLIALVILAATAGGSFATEARFGCDGDLDLIAVFSPVGATPSEVTLITAGNPGEIVLPQMLSANGGRYGDGQKEFWITGDTATLTRSGKSEACHVVSVSAAM